MPLLPSECWVPLQWDSGVQEVEAQATAARVRMWEGYRAIWEVESTRCDQRKGVGGREIHG